MLEELNEKFKSYEKLSEGRLFTHLPIIARVDGRSFSKFTASLNKPYQEELSHLMIDVTKYLVEETNAVCGYTQSDEISLLFSPAKETSQVFFNGKYNKMVSMLSAMTSVAFMGKMYGFMPEVALAVYSFPQKLKNWPVFDARVFNVTDEQEAVEYFYWREGDAVKNSISMAARSVYSHKEVDGKNSSEKQQMLWEKGINWNDYPDFFKRGTYLQRQKVEKSYTAVERALLPPQHEARKNPDLKVLRSEVKILSMPPLRKVADNVDIIFGRKCGVERE